MLVYKQEDTDNKSDYDSSESLDDELFNLIEKDVTKQKERDIYSLFIQRRKRSESNTLALGSGVMKMEILARIHIVLHMEEQGYYQIIIVLRGRVSRG